MSKFSKNSSNALKGIIVMATASIAFVLIISVFPIIGSLVTPGFQLGEVLKQNFDLLIILLGVGIPVGIMLGILASAIKRRRLFMLILCGFIFYWLMIIGVILLATGFSFTSSDLGILFSMSVWAMLAYSVFTLPLIMLGIFILERWTRKK
jgi:hypothetical protein